MRLKKIYWFAPFQLTEPSTRYRGYYPILHFRAEKGIKCHFVFPTKTLKGRLKFLHTFLSALFSRKNDSFIVIQKVCSNRIYARMLKALVSIKQVNTLYDIDDAEYLRQDTTTLHYFLKRCKIITVGSTALYDYCKKFSSNVVVLTSPVKEHNDIKSTRNYIPNIGWVGDLGNGNNISKEFSHKTSMFQILFPQLLAIKRPILITLIGVKNDADIPEIFEYFKDNANIEIKIPKNLDWENDNWIYSEIKKFDIGVSPINNHPFNVAKSAFKAKQYLSVGIPTIASDVGENRKFVHHTINGFLCQSNDDFKTAIEYIIDLNNDDYFRLSRAAINSQKDFSMRKYCDSLLEICNGAIQ